MIPKLNARGTSFKGLAAYLLHDKGSETSSDRVAWVETVNLATQNPQGAWRIMAATAMGAAELKAEAGIKKTGRSSKDAVLHLSLSWEPGEKPDRAQMSDFARRALKALKAEDRQAMVICHLDAKHPHVHVVINRVSPTDGRLLPSSKEKLALSALALAYEKENGAVVCKQRELNAAKRENGEYVRGEKDIPRPEFEAMRKAQDEALKEIPASVAAKQPEIVAKLRADIRAQVQLGLAAIRETLRPQWATLYDRQRQETEKGQQQKAAFVERLRGWLKSGDKTKSPALAFQRQSKALGIWHDGHRAEKQAKERGRLATGYKAEVGKMFDDIKAVCRQGLDRALRQVLPANDKGGSAPQFNPAAAGTAPPLTPAQAAVQRRLDALTEKVRQEGGGGRDQEPTAPKPKLPKSKERDREWEP
jgi:hypothetical protein